MITCPLCQKLVFLSHANENYPGFVEDNDLTSDFHCPTYTEVTPGKRWCHYERKVIPTGYVRYEAVIPPFVVQYWPALQHSKVEQFQFQAEDCNVKQVYHLPTESLEDFFKLCNRFTNLRAFS